MVDERDSSWEDDGPRFRVYLHGSGAESTSGWTATYDTTGADVLQARMPAGVPSVDRATFARLDRAQPPLLRRLARG